MEHQWYNTCRSKELSQKLIGSTIAETYIVVFRTESGLVAALEDHCAHRNTPLSKDRICRDYLGCPEHGCLVLYHWCCSQPSSTTSATPQKFLTTSYGDGEMGGHGQMGRFLLISYLEPRVLVTCPLPENLQIKSYSQRQRAPGLLCRRDAY